MKTTCDHSQWRLQGLNFAHDGHPHLGTQKPWLDGHGNAHKHTTWPSGKLKFKINNPSILVFMYFMDTTYVVFGPP